jgi:hypothetical protein
MINKILSLTLLFFLFAKGYFLASLEPITKSEQISLTRGLAWYNRVFLGDEIPINSAPLAGILDFFSTDNGTKLEKFDYNYEDFLSYLFVENKLNSLVTEINRQDLIVIRMKNLIIFTIIILSILGNAWVFLPIFLQEFLLIILTESQVILTLSFSLIIIKLLIANFHKRSIKISSSLGLLFGLLLATKTSFFLIIILLATSILTIDLIKKKLHKGFTKAWVGHSLLIIVITFIILWLFYDLHLISLNKLNDFLPWNLPDIKIIPFYEPLKHYLFSLIFPAEKTPVSWTYIKFFFVTSSLIAWLFAVRFLQKEKKYYLLSQGILTSFLLIFTAFSNETKFFINMVSLQSIIFLPNFIQIRL